MWRLSENVGFFTLLRVIVGVAVGRIWFLLEVCCFCFVCMFVFLVFVFVGFLFFGSLDWCWVLACHFLRKFFFCWVSELFFCLLLGVLLFCGVGCLGWSLFFLDVVSWVLLGGVYVGGL